MLNLHFSRPHLSIDAFEDVPLTDLTVLTGVNGAGKTHLLEAITTGAVSVGNIKPQSIVLFDYETFKLENERAHTAQEIADERQNVWNFLQGQLPNFRNWKSNIPQKFWPSLENFKKENRPIWGYKEGAELDSYRSLIDAHFENILKHQPQFAAPVYSMVKSSTYTLDEINKEQFMQDYRPISLKNDFLPQAIGKIIWDYYIKLIQNRVHRYQNEMEGTSYSHLSEEEFIQQNGEKPWIVINDILKAFNTIEYRLDSPEGAEIFGGFHLKLTHTRKPELKIDFSSLSSGERVLMALVASVYKAAANNSFPDLLLLDELDATLHPSMTRNLLGVISDVFLKKGTKVILVTHSPSTVAFAEESSLLVMKRSGEDRMTRCSKKEALSILTEGFATLDEGIMLFDQLAKQSLSILSEGRNVGFLKEALRHYKVDGVNIIEDIDDITGKTQLKTMYDFMCKIPHSSKVIIVWDCDVKYKLHESNNTYPFIFSRNDENSVAKKGIENLFPEHLFNDFRKQIILSKGATLVEFDESRKKDFEEFVIARNTKEDFANFLPLIQKIVVLQE